MAGGGAGGGRQRQRRGGGGSVPRRTAWQAVVTLAAVALLLRHAALRPSARDRARRLLLAASPPPSPLPAPLSRRLAAAPPPSPPPPRSVPTAASGEPLRAFVELANGVRMPRLGFGTAGLGADTEQATAHALSCGYRLLDSAQAREWYREDLVGVAVLNSAIPRDELFLVSKLHPRHLGYESTRERFQDSLRDLHTTYLDLFLLHYPECFSDICGAEQPSGTWQDSWRALENLYTEGRIRAIGVSNFDERQLNLLLEVAHIRPHVIQRNSDPLRADQQMQAFCRAERIQYMGYSTLGSQWQFSGHLNNPVLKNSQVRSIASARSCSPAQVVLQWALLHGQVVIPRSHSQQRILENFQAPGCQLSPADMAALDGLDGLMPTIR